jgi:HTH-type transcriptional regulator/antitoxin HigA
MSQKSNMTIESITNNEDYQKALKRLEVIFDAKKDSPENDELVALGILIEKYEDQHFPIE